VVFFSPIKKNVESTFFLTFFLNYFVTVIIDVLKSLMAQIDGLSELWDDSSLFGINECIVLESNFLSEFYFSDSERCSPSELGGNNRDIRKRLFSFQLREENHTTSIVQFAERQEGIKIKARTTFLIIVRRRDFSNFLIGVLYYSNNIRLKNTVRNPSQNHHLSYCQRLLNQN
jgi:hypothetical protein